MSEPKKKRAQTRISEDVVGAAPDVAAAKELLDIVSNRPEQPADGPDQGSDAADRQRRGPTTPKP